MATKTDERLARFCSEFLPKLVATFHPTMVIAFGSRARGEGLAHSDLDLVIVSDSFKALRWLDRPARVIEALGLDFGVDLLCYTPEEYARKREEIGIVRTAYEEGIVLVGEPTGV
ncbi:MAG: nucleotidyltransferase domain-containing protein [Nitrospirota bacterium]|nr:nucleotidyltransferase domain-containing protein [Nitrospirota bacterium]MDE3225880.1 nucleotidyltransferase domain-containing protein [Nitrospirota bacterium]MDE3243487.1 nucleotidyltransferase domain-containing protein [Nitrospirota bacterium]